MTKRYSCRTPNQKLQRTILTAHPNLASPESATPSIYRCVRRYMSLKLIIMKFKASLSPGIACAVVVCICFLYAYSRAELPAWWRNHGGGIPYVLFWVMLCLTAFPRRSTLPFICIACVLITCALEIGQIWDGPSWLYHFRRTKLGAALLGYGFDLNDFPPYFIGGFCGYLIGLAMLPGKLDSKSAT